MAVECSRQLPAIFSSVLVISRFMNVLRTVIDVQTCVRSRRQQGQAVAVVPTMGALHEGHLSLIRAACQDCDFVITTIFVNPTQFGPNEDFDQYPRDLQTDLDLCRSAGADLVFAPSVGEMYTSDSLSTVHVSGVSALLEGTSRPTHFDGVSTIVAKLFHITLPDRAYFGQTEYQQQLLIRRMVQDLNFPEEIVTCPIVREDDGLALSSRNRYLSSEERQSALVLSRTLREAAQLAASGTASPQDVQTGMVQQLDDADGVDPDYAVVVHPETLQPATEETKTAVALLAARVGRTRLIDNQILTFAD